MGELGIGCLDLDHIVLAKISSFYAKTLLGQGMITT